MLTKLKQRFQFWIASEAKIAHNLGLAPNHVSAVGILFAISSTLAYWNWQLHQILPIVAPILLLISGFCDALDGALARIYGETTTFGGFLDSLLDRYADSAVYIGIILGELCNITWGLVALIGSLLVSYSRARSEAVGIKMESIGLAERAERMIILAVTSITAFFWQPETAMNAGIILLALLSHLTVLQRGLYLYKKSRK